MPAGAGVPVGEPTFGRIPGGVWRGRPEPLRELPLRPVGAEDEAYLLDTLESLNPSERATRLLARCLSAGPEPGRVDDLTVGDREALLLQLRRLSLGDRLECVIACPAEACGALMEVELAVADLLVAAYADVRPAYDVRVEADGERFDVRFRLPTAGDLDAAAGLSQTDPELGATELLRRCVSRVAKRGRSIGVDRLGDEARRAIAAAMAERDPQAELELDLTCPTCGHAFPVLFDSGAFLLQELDARAAQLLEDVHALALHYHWSERDILALPANRRERYLELLAATLRGAAGGFATS